MTNTPPPLPPHPDTPPANPDTWSGQPSQLPVIELPVPTGAMGMRGCIKLGTGEQVELAGVGSRLAARLIDFFVLLGIFLGIFRLLVWLIVFLGTSDGEEPVDSSILSLVVWQIFFAFFIAWIYYEVIPTAKWGRTLGKHIMNIRVVRADYNAQPGGRKSFRRGILLGLLLIIPPLGLIILWLSWNDSRQGWYDKRAGIVVLKGRNFTALKRRFCMTNMPPPPPPNPDAWSSQHSQSPSQLSSAMGLQNTGQAILGSGEQVELAGVGSRLVAKVIDIVICWGAFIQLVVVISLLVSYDGGESTDISFLSALGALAVHVLVSFIIDVVLYDPVLTAIWGRTLGKHIMNIRVVRADYNAKPGVGRLFGRWVVQLVALFTISGLLFVYLSILWDDFRQGWHDRGGGTFVVKGRDFI